MDQCYLISFSDLDAAGCAADQWKYWSAIHRCSLHYLLAQSPERMPRQMTASSRWRSSAVIKPHHYVASKMPTRYTVEITDFLKRLKCTPSKLMFTVKSVPVANAVVLYCCLITFVAVIPCGNKSTFDRCIFRGDLSCPWYITLIRFNFLVFTGEWHQLKRPGLVAPVVRLAGKIGSKREL